LTIFFPTKSFPPPVLGVNHFLARTFLSVVYQLRAPCFFFFSELSFPSSDMTPSSSFLRALSASFKALRVMAHFYLGFLFCLSEHGGDLVVRSPPRRTLWASIVRLLLKISPSAFPVFKEGFTVRHGPVSNRTVGSFSLVLSVCQHIMSILLWTVLLSPSLPAAERLPPDLSYSAPQHLSHFPCVSFPSIFVEGPYVLFFSYFPVPVRTLKALGDDPDGLFSWFFFPAENKYMSSTLPPEDPCYPISVPTFRKFSFSLSIGP